MRRAAVLLRLRICRGDSNTVEGEAVSDVILLYLFTRLDSINAFFTIVAVVSGFIGIGTIGLGHLEGNKQSIAVAKKMLIVSAISGVLSILAPTKTDVAVIVGGKFAIDAGRSETGKALAADVLAAIRAQLESVAKGRK